MERDPHPLSPNAKSVKRGKGIREFFASRFALRSDALWRVMGLVKDMKGRVISANLVLMIASMLATLAIVALKPMIDYVADPANALIYAQEAALQAAEPAATVWHQADRWQDARRAQFWEWAASVTPTQFIGTACALLVVVLILQALFQFGGMYLIGNVGIDATSSLLRRVFGNVVRQEMQFFDQTSTGSLLNTCYREVFGIRDMITFLTSTRVMLPVKMLFLFIALIIINARFTLMLVCLLPIVILPTILLTRKLKKTLRAEVEGEAGPMDLMTEVFTGIRAVKTFGAEQQERDFMDPSIDQYVEMTRKRRTAQALIEPTVDVLNMLVLVLVFFAATAWSGALQQEPGALVAFMFATTRFYKPFRSLMTMNIQLQRSRMMATRIFNLLDREPRIVEAAQPVPFPNPWRCMRFEGVGLDYRIKHRTRYRTREALRQIDLHINRGEAVALIGPNGAGKSSIVNLLCRLYEPTRGAIMIDHVPLNQIRLAEIHEKICLITQYPILFNRSVFDNIAFGMQGLSENQIREAARAVRAEAFIDALPDGFETLIGEQGKLLSGGERQKLVLARAFVRHPEIVIFDEPTTGLDVETTAEFLELIDQMHARGITVIYITHEASQLVRMDRVYRLTGDRMIIEETKSDYAAVAND